MDQEGKLTESKGLKDSVFLTFKKVMKEIDSSPLLKRRKIEEPGEYDAQKEKSFQQQPQSRSSLTMDDILSRDISAEIFSHASFSGSDWLNIKLVCKKWKKFADSIFDPSSVQVNI